MYKAVWLGFGKPTKLSQQTYSILLAQLVATLIHHPFTVPLSGYAEWSAFIEQVLLPYKFTTDTIGPMEGTTWKP